MNKRLLFKSTCIALLTASYLLIACSQDKSPPPPDMKEQMDRVYQAVAKLSDLSWHPVMFADPANRQEIIGLLNTLKGDFHKVDGKDAKPTHPVFDGFKLSLDILEGQIEDIRLRFEEGSTDYAAWKIKGLSANCVACHSRFNLPAPFALPLPGGDGASTVDSRMQRSIFLFAGRQYAESLSELELIIKSKESSGARLEALKLWLYLQLRVLGQPEVARTGLQLFYEQDTSKTDLPILVSKRKKTKQKICLEQTSVDRSEFATLVHSWIEALDAGEFASPEEALLRHRQSMDSEVSIPTREKMLVVYLGIISLVHKQLDMPIQEAERRHALLLLAWAYKSMPIALFELDREMYMEQCIREYPGSDEAKKCYLLFKEHIEETFSGANGLFLTDSQHRQLAKLRSIAYDLGDTEGDGS